MAVLPAPLLWRKQAPPTGAKLSLPERMHMPVRPQQGLLEEELPQKLGLQRLIPTVEPAGRLQKQPSSSRWP